MYVDLRSAIGRGILVTGVFDPLVFVPIRGALAAGGNFLDIGANVGYYSVLAAQTIAGRGAVYAFEIDPRPLRCLRRNARLVGLDRIAVQEVAVGALQAVRRLTPGQDSGHTRVVEKGDGPIVEMTSIDAWRRRHGVRDIRAIKIDIEGGEFAALQGATETLEIERPLIVFEVLDNAEALGGASRAEIFAFVRQLGYRVSEAEGTLSPTFVARPREPRDGRIHP